MNRIFFHPIRKASFTPRLFWSILLLFGCLSWCSAQQDPVLITVLEGKNGSIHKDSLRETVDLVYYSPLLDSIADPAKDRYVNSVSFYVDENYPVLAESDFRVDLLLTLIWTDMHGAVDSLNGKQLTIQYKAGQDSINHLRSYFRVDSCRKLTVRIDSVNLNGCTWDATRMLVLENRMQVYREYVFDCRNIVSGLAHGLGPISVNLHIDKIVVSWTPSTAPGTTDYDLEWAWIDYEARERYMVSGSYNATAIFKNNSTRVTLPADQSNFGIPMLYDGEGLLFYRIRPIHLNEKQQVAAGAWTPISDHYAHFGGHAPNLNWQVSTSFAEEGKHKTVIQYFDGTLRNRQSVTKDNDTETTVIAETLYDYQGRPAINILPAPTLNNVIEYAHDFNRFTSDIYPKDVYDLLPSGELICDRLTPILDSASGASNYYSSNNLLINGLVGNLHDYIPSAFGYPYTETQYTPDATGRIAAQGGVGKEYQLNRNHETKYFYGSADQKELDALFGTEVGDATHYFKNMVRDGNGQYSVSYVDMRGRTIATALAGNVPDSLEQLPGFQSRYFTRNLLTEGNNQVKDRTVESSSTLLVTREALHEFHYELTPQSAEILACNLKEGDPMGELPVICYDCYYDLEIRISSACLEEPILITRKNFSFGEYDVSCSTAAPMLSVDTSFVMAPGEYNITKTLRLSQDAQNWYRQNLFAERNICKTLEDFYNENYDVLVSADNCNLNCDSCHAQLGEYDDYRTAFLLSQGVDPGTEVTYEEEIKISYNEALEACNLLCAGPAQNKLDMIRDLMLLDMTPGQGQYATVDRDLDGNGSIDANVSSDYGNGMSLSELNTNKPFNIFNTKAAHRYHPISRAEYSTLVPVYRHPFNPDNNTGYYLNEADNPESYFSNPETLAAIGADEFTRVFRDAWARSLLYYHPEYDRLVFAEANLSDSYDWDVTLENTDTWEEALAAGFISNNILNLDPFFNGPMGQKRYGLFNRPIFQQGRKYRDVMSDYLSDEYRRYEKTIWQLALISVNCNDNDVACINSFSPYPPYTAADCGADKDAVWRTFRAIYLAEKERMISDLIEREVEHKDRDKILNNTAYGYQRRFINYDRPGGIMDNIMALNDKSGNASIEDANQLFEEQMAEMADATCKGYIEMWTNALLECEALRNHASRDVILQKIMAGLVHVCKGGTDLDHINGSSTVNPNGSGDAPYSFEQVIHDVFYQYEIDEDEICHPYLINYPQPYEKQSPVSDGVVTERNDECVCSRMQELETAKTQAAFSGTLSEYIAQAYNITIRQSFLDSLNAGCADNGECRLYDPAIAIPAILDCETNLNTCIDCQQYAALKTEFVGKYSASAAVFYESPATDEELSHNQFFGKFLNARTGFAKHWIDYLEFEKLCQGYDTSWSCNALQNIVANYLANGGDTVSAANCNTAFTTFFNTEAGTAYTFSQIQSLFLEHCDGLPDICAPTIDCAGFNAVIDSFYIRYGNTVSLDLACDSLFADHFNGIKGTAYNYAQLQALYASTCGQPLDVCTGLDCERLVNVLNAWKSCNPIIFLYSGCDSLWTTYFNNQFGSSYSYLQIDSLYRQCNIELNPCQVQADCSTLKKLLFAYQNADTLACAPAGLNPADTSYCQDCFVWFVNDRLGTSYSYTQLSNLYLNQCGVTLALCGQGFNCKELTVLANGFRQWLVENPEAGPCDSLFAVRFNEHFDLDYSYDQILLTYKQYCGKSVEFCVPDPVVNCQQLEAINLSFRQLYPDPVRYLGDSLQSVFTQFYNSIAGDTLNFDEIRMQYWVLCQTELDLIAADTCLQLTQFVTDFNNQYGGYQWPQALARDLFTTLFNQQFQPVEPYYWDDLLRIYADDSCDAAIPVFPADSAYKLTCSNLQGAQRAFNIMYPVTSSDDCAKLFVGMINTYFGTSFSSGEQLQQWADDNCGEFQLKICGGQSGPVRLVLRSTSVPVTTVLPPRLCGTSPIVPTIVEEEGDPCDYQQTMALHLATEQYQVYVQQQFENFDSTYRANCINAGMGELFTVRAQAAEYHFTLYYYDQAGNLVKTVPPAGVDMSEMANETDYEQWHEDVMLARAAGTTLTPNHVLPTQYRYNSLNQVVMQNSPDGGSSHFWYDRLGRLVVSQNAKQAGNDQYSYTQYDAIGRITEVGQIEGSTVSQALTQNPASLSGWLTTNTNTREQITNTYYDLAVYEDGDIEAVINQKNLRNRVSFSALTNLATDEEYASATFYSYDIHGNVDVLLQQYFTGMMKDASAHETKKIEYNYDLISGKVNEVAYQPGYADQFYHRYEYDASNRLTKVLTSHDYLYWERQAGYEYYKHGPLARIELGQLNVQGLDYAYTLQGWLKGVNSAAIGAGFDMGGDGANIERAAKDVYGFQLQYNNVDYKAISNSDYPFAIAHYLDNQTDALRTGRGLFNGNISSMLVNIPQLGEAHLYGYAYDQLNRIVGMNAYTGLNNTTGALVPAATTNNSYLERVSFDANGNILTYKRNGEAADYAMDNLTYQYDMTSGRLNNNQLQYVDDAVAGNTYTADIKDQSSGNYEYDAIGNLIREGQTAGEHNLISWNVYGKISEIVKKNGASIVSTIQYVYDVSGNRIGKTVIPPSGPPVKTWYVRDATGNVMAIYEQGNAEINEGELSQTEVPLYGSSRLGMWRPNRAVGGEDWEIFEVDPAPGTGGVREEEFVRGRTQYELSNHLGNVLVTISDNRVPVDDGTYDVVTICPSCLPGYPCLVCYNEYIPESGTADGIIDYYTAVVLTANDYYPFGMGMPGRKYSADGAYRYGFNGKENDNEVKGEGNQQDYGMRIYDPRLGRFLSEDPLTKDYPWYTPYQFAGNTPIKFIDLDGLEPSGNFGDWENLQDGQVYSRYVYNSAGKPVLARVQNHYIQDKFGWKGWIARYKWSDTYGGLTQTSNSYKFYDGDPKVEQNVELWKPFETSQITAQRQMISLARNTAIGVFGIAVVGAAAPASPYLINGGSNVSRYLWQQSVNLSKKFGTDFIYNTGVEYLSNRGNVGEMDWFDIAVGTFNPLRKFSYGAFGSELLSSTVDVKLNTGVTSIFDQSKSGIQFLIDFGAGQAKALSIESFEIPGGKNLNRNFVLDVFVGQAKFEGQNWIEKIRRNGFSEPVVNQP